MYRSIILFVIKFLKLLLYPKEEKNGLEIIFINLNLTCMIVTFILA